jgi:hypothetical protein
LEKVIFYYSASNCNERLTLKCLKQDCQAIGRGPNL